MIKNKKDKTKEKEKRKERKTKVPAKLEETRMSLSSFSVGSLLLAM